MRITRIEWLMIVALVSFALIAVLTVLNVF